MEPASSWCRGPVTNIALGLKQALLCPVFPPSLAIPAVSWCPCRAFEQWHKWEAEPAQVTCTGGTSRLSLWMRL